MNQHELLEKAFSFIDTKDKWCQRSCHARYVDGRESYCSMGALNIVTTKSNRAMAQHPNDCDYKLRNNLSLYLLKAIGTSSSFTDATNRVVKYNDNHSYEKVREMWQKAIALAKAEEGEVIELPQPNPDPEPIAA